MNSSYQEIFSSVCDFIVNKYLFGDEFLGIYVISTGSFSCYITKARPIKLFIRLMLNKKYVISECYLFALYPFIKTMLSTFQRQNSIKG